MHADYPRRKIAVAFLSQEEPSGYGVDEGDFFCAVEIFSLKARRVTAVLERASSCAAAATPPAAKILRSWSSSAGVQSSLQWSEASFVFVNPDQIDDRYIVGLWHALQYVPGLFGLIIGGRPYFEIHATVPYMPST